MKRIFLTGLPLLLLLACGHKKQGPDVSGVMVEDVHIERFDTAFFALDSNNILTGLHRLAREFPWFTNDFVANVLGAGPLSDTNRVALQASRQFMVSYLPVKDSLEGRYRQLGWLEKELKNGFQHVKYYFPKYPLPRKVVCFIGPFDGPGVAITPFALAIGLQSWAGKDFPFYLTGKGQDMYPLYISRRFEPAYITAGCMKAIADDLFPDNSDNAPLIEQMIGKGRYWWLLDKFLPDAPDSIKSGFTARQLNWCAANEGIIWNFFLTNTDLFTIDPEIIKNYIGEGPGTQGMPDVAPGNIGVWTGWQIVKKYADAHSDLTPEQLMRIPVRKIFDEAKYKPK
ncbi:MAG TPA: hypothetical protein VK563_16080 [Puia sp.]|nr:hypothetical protein [Puia sp.]